jgi:hypothetical protein
MLLDLSILQWIVLVLVFWVIILTIFLIQTSLHYRRLTKNITKKDLKSLLSQILNTVQLNEKELKDLNSALKKVRNSMMSHIQKIGFVRFNPFPQTGGDQSFCLVLLDEKDNGFVLSSLHSRDTTRFYAKTIKNGKADGYELSKEERKAIKNAK